MKALLIGTLAISSVCVWQIGHQTEPTGPPPTRAEIAAAQAYVWQEYRAGRISRCELQSDLNLLTTDPRVMSGETKVDLGCQCPEEESR